MPLPPELELWKVKLNAFHRLSWKFVEGLLSGVLLISKEHKIKNNFSPVLSSSVTILIHVRIIIHELLLLWHHHGRQHSIRIGYILVHDGAVPRGHHSGEGGVYW